MKRHIEFGEKLADLLESCPADIDPFDCLICACLGKRKWSARRMERLRFTGRMAILYRAVKLEKIHGIKLVGHVHGGNSGELNPETTLLAKKAKALRASGLSFPSIASELNVTQGYAWHLVRVR